MEFIVITFYSAILFINNEQLFVSDGIDLTGHYINIEQIFFFLQFSAFKWVVLIAL